MDFRGQNVYNAEIKNKEKIWGNAEGDQSGLNLNLYRSNYLGESSLQFSIV